MKGRTANLNSFKKAWFSVSLCNRLRHTHFYMYFVFDKLQTKGNEQKANMILPRYFCCQRWFCVLCMLLLLFLNAMKGEEATLTSNYRFCLNGKRIKWNSIKMIENPLVYNSFLRTSFFIVLYFVQFLLCCCLCTSCFAWCFGPKCITSTKFSSFFCAPRSITDVTTCLSL